MSNKKSRWYKMVGGDFGAIKLQPGGWIWFRCLWCAKMLFPQCFTTPRWQGPPSKAIHRAEIDGRSGQYVIRCQGAETHKAYLANKKEKTNA